MQEYLFWIVTTVMGLAIGVIGFFMKRSIAQIEKKDEEHDKRVRELESRLNQTIKELPFLYTLREDSIRAQAAIERRLDNTDRKLDKALDLLVKLGGGSRE